MAKIKFREIKMSRKNQERLDYINEIIEEYQEQGYTLTLRQLYYQLVSRDVIPNKQNEYAKLSTLLKEGRMAGIVDWDAIEDRLRKPSRPAAFDGPQDIIDAAVRQYRKDRQEGQDTHIEVWVEKDALSGVLKRITQKYGISIMVNRGYSSASAMFDSYERFVDAFRAGQKVKILYLGDFDPSGVDMIRDIKDRVDEFIVGSDEIKSWASYSYPDDTYKKTVDNFIDEGLDDDEAIIAADELFAESKVQDFVVLPIALTIAQIKEYNPPPNPAKITDPRAKDFVKRYGGMSWEVDALKPQVLNDILEKNILENLDLEKYEAIIEKEKIDIIKLNKLSKNL